MRPSQTPGRSATISRSGAPSCEPALISFLKPVAVSVRCFFGPVAAALVRPHHSGQPRLALYSLAEGVRTPFQAEPTLSGRRARDVSRVFWPSSKLARARAQIPIPDVMTNSSTDEKTYLACFLCCVHQLRNRTLQARAGGSGGNLARLDLSRRLRTEVFSLSLKMTLTHRRAGSAAGSLPVPHSGAASAAENCRTIRA